MDIKEIKNLLDNAANTRNKIAMFHYITLKHAQELINEDPKEFCRIVGMRESYATEFLKMRALSTLMQEQNLSL